MAGQWFALPKLFKSSENKGYEIAKNDKDLIQFKNEESWTFKVIPKSQPQSLHTLCSLPPVSLITFYHLQSEAATIDALVSLSLDPGTVDSDFIQVKYHKTTAMKVLAFAPKWQADNAAKNMDSSEVAVFEADKGAGKQKPRTYGNGTGDAPTKDLVGQHRQKESMNTRISSGYGDAN